MRKYMLGIYSAVVCFSSTAMAGEIYPRPSQDEELPITRAEVLADLEMWNRAGMNRYPREEMYPDIRQNSDYQKRLSEYRRLRSGPEFQTTVQNFKSKVGSK